MRQVAVAGAAYGGGGGLLKARQSIRAAGCFDFYKQPSDFVAVRGTHRMQIKHQSSDIEAPEHLGTTVP